MVIDIKQELTNLGYDYKTEGNDTPVTQFSSITEAKNNDLAFCYYEGEKAIGYIAASNAGIILCKKTIIGNVHPKNGQQFFFLDNPRLAFVQVLKKATKAKTLMEISNNSVIHNSAKIGSN